MCFDEIEYRLGRPDTVDCDDFVTGLRAALQNVLEHPLLRIERLEVPGTGVQPDFADIACLPKVLIP